MRHTVRAVALLLIMVTGLIAGCGSPAPSTTAPATETAPAETTASPLPTTTTPSPTATATATATATSTAPVITGTIAPTETPTVAVFSASSPVSEFSDEDIAYLGLDFSGTDTQIADAIRVWQEDTWNYVNVENADAGYRDVSDPIRWNYFLPGIFPSRDITRELVRDGRIYGICFNYAVTYCSIAEYYGLETRVMSTISKISDSDPSIISIPGMDEDEYERLKVKLAGHDLQYDHEAVNLVAEETPGHYWAEVKLNGQWVIQDATQKAVGFYNTANLYTEGDYQIYDWKSRDRSAELAEYQRMLNAGERLPEVEGGDDGYAPAPPEGYTGMTDDLGQAGRAASIDDLMKGWAYAPYFNDAADAYAFIKASVPAFIIEEDQELQDEYEAMTGNRLYLVALLVSPGDDVATVEEYYYRYCGEELDTSVYSLLFGD